MTIADAVAPRRPSEPSFVSGRFALGMLGALVLVAVVLPVADPGRIAWVRAALIAFGGLVQATPFVLGGARLGSDRGVRPTLDIRADRGSAPSAAASGRRSRRHRVWAV